MNGIDRLHGIAEDVGRTVWLRDLGAALHDTLDAIEREARDPSGYESDVLAWVEENGGLDAVRERLMPEGMSWPFYEDGEPVRIGEYVICDERCSPAAVDFIEFNESGFKLYGESGRLIAGSDMPCGERVKRPAPPVLDADGGEIRVGDEVWSTTGEFDGKRTVSSVHIDPDEPPYAMFEELQKPYSCLCCYLTHRRPAFDADGVLIKKGDTVWHKATGIKYRVFRFSAMENRVWGENDFGSFLLDCSMLTHTKPEPPDSWEKWREDFIKPPCVYCRDILGVEFDDDTELDKAFDAQVQDMERRARALAEKED